MENYNFEDPTFEASYEFRFLCGIIEAIEAQSSENLTKVIRNNTRILAMDKANGKLLVLIKKLHVTASNPMGPAGIAMPGSVQELDLVNGGDEIYPKGVEEVNEEHKAANGDGFDLC